MRGSINPRIHLSYQFDTGPVQVTPFIDFDAYYAWIDSYSKSGAGLANLTFSGVSQHLYAVTPGLELAIRETFDETTRMRAFLRGAVQLSKHGEWETETQFIAAPKGLPGIKITEPFDGAVAKLNAGIQLFNEFGGQFRVEYSGAFSESTEQHQASGNLSFQF